MLAFDDIGRADRAHACARCTGPAAARDPHVFVNLDMEEYRDLDLTVAAFTRVLDEPEFARLDAGIVLQAYLPDSHDVARPLVRVGVARRRGPRRRPIKVRLVKGANLAMERVEAELHGWVAAPYGSKADVDANYKRCSMRSLRPELRRRGRRRRRRATTCSTSRGRSVAASTRAAPTRPGRVRDARGHGAGAGAGGPRRGRRLLLYAPVVAATDFAGGIAYLFAAPRREHRSRENFLRALFDLADRTRPSSTEQATLPPRRAPAPHGRPPSPPRRASPRPRATPTVDSPTSPTPTSTDPAAASWLRRRVARPRRPRRDSPAPIGDVDAIDGAMAAAAAASRAGGRPRRRPARRLLARRRRRCAADASRRIAVMAHEAGKTVAEGDPEVSEAIDFARYYAGAARSSSTRRSTASRVRRSGVVVVAPPWNFPFAIPAGGCLGALAAGNAVILKPAPQTRGHRPAHRRAVLGGRRPARRAAVRAVPPTTTSAGAS